MLTQFPRAFEYSARALIAMAQEPDSVHTIDAICDQQGIAKNYVIKLMRPLRDAGLVRSLKGYHGGFKLLRHTKQTTLWDIYEAVVGAYDEHSTCLVAGKRCPIDEIVAREVNIAIREALQRRSLHELANHGGMP